MRRRDFVRQTLLASMAACGSSSVLVPRRALADTCTVADMPRTLVNVMLQGGADFRFLFMPAPSHPDGSYLDMIWSARRSLYSNDYASYEQMFNEEYLLATDPLGGSEFGIFKQAGWLHEEFQAGRAAVVANAFCSRNRRHDQSILNADAGEPELNQLRFDRDGWGGRLVEQTEAASTAVELGRAVSVFSKGSEPGARLARVVHAQDMRNMALAGTDPELPVNGRRNALARALHSWYDARAVETEIEQPAQWPYHTFFQHRAALQEFGQAVESRLDACLALPDSLSGLELNEPDFTQQCRNLFDACQLPDVLRQRVMSMSYGGWDTHDNEYAEIGSNLSDLFGSEGGFATALPEIAQLPYLDVPAEEQMVFYFASDFGRQLRANGTAGADHGSGTYSIMLGRPVRGGIYGEMFPVSETQSDADGRIPLQTEGADIRGLTSTERILSAACEWSRPGSSAAVFPDAGTADLEQAGLLDGLLPG